ncbi:helix-turn-helix domain-containing protein [Endothiovibrio diazotrophicus]
MSTNLISDLISQSEAARLRGCSRQAISKLVQNGKLRGYEVAGRILVSRTEVERFQAGKAGRPKKEE